MPAFKFLGFQAGAAVALSINQGALSDSASVLSWAQNSSLTVSLDATRLTGTAPMGVMFSATATSDDPRVESPFHDVEGIWRFDDPGDFTALTNNPIWGTDRNVAYGPEATHVFDTPGTYEVSYQATDGGSVITETITITVEDPDIVFAGDTAVVSQVGDFTGAPSGASQFTSISAAESHLSGRTNMRLLLRAGETFTSGVAFNETAGSNRRLLVGRFGSGSNPLISTSGTGISIDGTQTNFKEAIVDSVDILGPYDPADPYNSSIATGDGISFPGGGGSITDAHKTIWGCDIRNIGNISINMDGSSTTPAKYLYVGNCAMIGCWNYHLLCGDGGWIGLSGCTIQQPTGTINGSQTGSGVKFTLATALHNGIRLSRPDGPLVVSNCDMNSMSNWSASSTSRSYQPVVRWNTNQADQKLVIDRLRAEGGKLGITNGTSNTEVNDNWVVVDRYVFINAPHAETSLNSPMGGVTFRNCVAVVPDTVPGTSTGNRSQFSDATDFALGPGAQTRRSECYSVALIDLRRDAYAGNRTLSNTNRNFDAGGYDNITNSFFGNNILFAPNMTSGGNTAQAPLDTTVQWVTNIDGERWENEPLDTTRDYGDEVTALFMPQTGSSAIGGATGKVSLIDFNGNLRSDVLAGLTRSTPSEGPFEPSEEN